MTSPAALAFPELPTIDESGVPGFESTTSTAIAMPVATPKDIVQKLRDAPAGVLDKPVVRQIFEKSGGQLFRSTPEEFVRMLAEEHARWVKIRRETGIRIE